MKILITGGAGFIGSHIVDACVQRGDEVFIIDNLSTGQRANIAHHDTNTTVHFREVDIRDGEGIRELFVEIQPEVVYHLAAQINVRESIKDPLKTMEVNIDGTINILDSMVASWCRRFIFSSTGGVMFSTDTPPYRESDVPSPTDPYGISKLSWEQIIDFYARQYGLDATVLRYSNVYWPRQNAKGEAGVITIFLEKIKNGETPTIFGDGSQTRDFIHVADVVSANIHALEKNLTGIYHVGTGIETSVNELWQILATSTGTSLVPVYVPALGEIQRTALDCAKLCQTWWTVEKRLGEIVA